MFVIFKTAISIIKKRKLQSVLISIVMILISILLYTGISMVNQNSPFKTMFERANATESMLIISNEGSDIEESTKWWKDREEVKDTISYESFLINGKFELNENTETEMMLLTEYLEGTDLDLLYENGEKLGKIPEKNQMLINYNFAKDRDLEVGDEVSFTFEKKEYVFQVSGFIVDPHFSNPFINPSRCFIAPNYFEENNIKNDTTLLSIKYYDIEKVDDIALYETYSEEISNASSPIFLDYHVIQNSYNIILGIISVILLVVSMFIFVIVVFVIRSTIHNLILQQYKEIGVKKVIGYTNKQIRNSMLIAYGCMAFVASLVGSFMGLPVRKMINAGISYDIQVGLSTRIDLFLPLTVGLIVALVIFFAYLATRKSNKIKPVQAIKYGRPEEQVEHNGFSIITNKKTPLSLLLSIKQLNAHKGKTITTTLLITLLIYVALVISNTGSNLANSEHLASHLLGYRIGDFTVMDNSEESAKSAMDKIESIDQVDRAIYLQYNINDSTLTADGSTLTVAGQIIYGNAPDDFIIIADGRQPSSINEIAVSSDLARETGKSTGDYMSIQSGEEKVTYLISGTYNSISFSGSNYTLLQKTVPDDLSIEGKMFWVYSGDQSVIIDVVDARVKNLFGDEATVSKYDNNVKNILSTVSSFPIVIQSLLLIFLVVSGVIILNSTIMDIKNSNKEYGIMKAIGYSKELITRILVIRTLIMTMIGTVLGFILNLLTMNGIMQGVFKVTPFSSIELPVIFDAKGSFVLLLLFIVIGVLSTLIPARRIGKISPRQLISE